MAYLDQVSYGGTLYDVNDTKGRAMIAPKEESSTASAAHAAGTYFTYNDLLYRATAAIAVGGTITPGTNCEAVTVGAETSELKSALDYIGDVFICEKAELDHASVDSGGNVAYHESKKLVCFRVKAGTSISVTGTFDVYGFFAAHPEIGSVTYNGAITVSSTLSNVTVPAGCTWVAVRASLSDTGYSITPDNNIDAQLASVNSDIDNLQDDVGVIEDNVDHITDVFICGKFEMDNASINASGKIEYSATTKMVFFRVEAGSKISVSGPFSLYGYYASKPNANSTTYNSSRTISSNIQGATVPAGCTWIGIRSLRADTGHRITPDMNVIPKSQMDFNSYDILLADGVFNEKTSNGVTFAWDGPTVIANAASASTGEAFINVINSANAMPKGIEAGKTYQVVFASSDSAKLRAQINIYKNSVNTSQINITASGYVTIPDDTTGVVIRYDVPSGVTLSNATARLSLLSSKSNAKLEENVKTLSGVGTAYISYGHEQNVRFEPDSSNNLFFSWTGNLLTYINGRSVGFTFSDAATAVGSDYTGTSPSGANAIKIPTGYMLVVGTVGNSRPLSVVDVASFDALTMCNLLYNRMGQVTAGEMLKYYTLFPLGNGGVYTLTPSNLRVCGGREMNIYYQNIVRYANPGKWHFMLASGVFSTYKQFLRWTPANDATTSSAISVRFYKDNDTIFTKTNTINVAAVLKTAGSGLSKKVMFIGDSMTDADHYPQDVVDLFADDAMDVTLVGTLGTQTAPNEGRSGWRAYTYCRCAQGSDDLAGLSYTNPFYNNGHFDFSYYAGTSYPAATGNAFPGVDYVFICLGTNDVAPSRSAHSTDADIIEYWDEMIASIQAYATAQSKTIKIALWMPPVGAFMENNNRAQIDTNLRIHKIILENYDGRENEGIYLCPVYMNVDPYHDYPYNSVNVSARNSNFQMVVSTDAVHPSTSGYAKIADVIYSLIKYFGSLDA